MSELFVDASGWVAVVNKSDALHAMAKSIYNQRFATGQVIITTTAVMMEVGNVLSLVRMRHLAVNLRHRLESSPRVHIIEADNMLYRAGWELYEQRTDKEWGVIDCISFCVMKQHGILEALTEDYHFTQAGFTKLL